MSPARLPIPPLWRVRSAVDKCSERKFTGVNANWTSPMNVFKSNSFNIPIIFSTHCLIFCENLFQTGGDGRIHKLFATVSQPSLACSNTIRRPLTSFSFAWLFVVSHWLVNACCFRLAESPLQASCQTSFPIIRSAIRVASAPLVLACLLSKRRCSCAVVAAQYPWQAY